MAHPPRQSDPLPTKAHRQLSPGSPLPRHLSPQDGQRIDDFGAATLAPTKLFYPRWWLTAVGFFTEDGGIGDPALEVPLEVLPQAPLKEKMAFSTRVGMVGLPADWGSLGLAAISLSVTTRAPAPPTEPQGVAASAPSGGLASHVLVALAAAAATYVFLRASGKLVAGPAAAPGAPLGVELSSLTGPATRRTYQQII